MTLSLRHAALVGCIGAASMTALAQKPDRSAVPKLGAPPALTVPSAQKHALSNGLTVWVVEQHEVPLAQVNLLVRAGSAADPAGRYGVASLTADLLDEGAGARSALEIADAVDFLGARLETASTFDSSAVRLSTPVARLADALPLMTDVVVRPTFPGEELERLRKERLTGLLQARDDPAAIVGLAFRHFVFGGHRYGTPAGGGPADLKGITVDDVRAFHRNLYRPSNSVLLVVGDVSAAAVVPLLERTFGAWRPDGTAAPATALPAATQLTNRQIYVIDKPNAAQSQIRIGWVGVSRSSADYPVIRVLNTMLGGSFTSRLNTNLRETHGYAYGAFSTFDELVSPGAFFAAAGVQTDKTAEALREFFNEFTAIRKPISTEELDKAKNYVALTLPAEFETIGDLARKLEEQVIHSLPDDYFPAFVRSVLQVTGAAVLKAAQQYVQPDKFAVVVVGDRKVIEAPIRALNLGPVKVLTVDEALGPM